MHGILSRPVRMLAIAFLFIPGAGIMSTGAADTLSMADKLQIQQYIMAYVRNEYVDSLSTSDLLDGAIEGMINKLDPHSSYLPPQAADDFSERIRGEFAGIGITFTMINNKITVIDVVEGGPSEAAGLRSRDKIVKIDGKDAKGISQDAIKERLRGIPGSKVTVHIERPGRQNLMEVTITRNTVDVNSVSHSYMLDATTGYVSLTRFSVKTRSDVEQALAKLKDKGMKRLILDLRNNSGGVLDSAVGVVSLFIKDGKIVYTQGRKKTNDRVWNASGDAPYPDLPLIVMINHASASASEIVAGALQDHDRALIVGQTSFGKGLVMNPIRLSSPDPRSPGKNTTLGTLMLSVSRYYTPSGRLIQRPYDGNRDDYIKEAFDDIDPNAADSSKIGKPVFKTDLGRNVYGGGGITPDVTLTPLRRLNPLERTIRNSNLSFEFADDYYLNQKNVNIPEDFTAYLAQYRISASDIGKFRTFIIGKGVNIDSLSTFGEEFDKFIAKYDIPIETVKKMKRVLSEDKANPDENLFERSASFIERELKQEIARIKWGPEERYRVWHQDDTELAAAMALFPQSEELLAARLTGKN